MSGHSGLRYLFDQPNPNYSQGGWLAMNNEFDFDIRHIKGKQVADVLSRRVQVNNRYYHLNNRLQQKGIGEEDVDYHLMVDDFFRFKENIYVPDNSELNNIILWVFMSNRIQVTQEIIRH